MSNYIDQILILKAEGMTEIEAVLSLNLSAADNKRLLDLLTPITFE